MVKWDEFRAHREVEIGKYLAIKIAIQKLVRMKAHVTLFILIRKYWDKLLRAKAKNKVVRNLLVYIRLCRKTFKKKSRSI